MQSILQYRRVKRDLRDHLKQGGASVAEKNSPGSGPTTNLLAMVDDNSRVFLLRGGQKIPLSGVHVHRIHESVSLSVLLA